MKIVAFKHPKGQSFASIYNSKLTPGLTGDGTTMNYHVINCPDDIDMGHLHWIFNSTLPYK